MYILTKSIFAIMIGFLSSAVLGLILIPILKRLKTGQKISVFVGNKHQKKEGTPTLGGLIFIIPTVVSTLYLGLTGRLHLNNSLLMVLFVFVSYGIIGFLDDFLSLKKKFNEGLTEIQKLVLQIVVALIFFYLYMLNGGTTDLIISSLGINIEMGWVYGLFILFVLVGASNAVNLTDGEDGLAGGLSAIAFIAFALISMVVGYEDIAIFSLILTGSLFGFLVYNTHPAKVFMGDTGSLSLGAAMAAIAIITHREITLAVVAGVFIIETLSVMLQTSWMVMFRKKIFLMTPLHHHFEKLGWQETDIVKLFWVVGLCLAMSGIFFGVWL
ncbi:MAG: phospho-N-acetylmuramoyl-pentapeptide-transferase [Bacilli bacterium]|nr:phospho-N-acetylmuramoyl-pentapeptide-transferase [Bacilli bacterium]